MAAAIELEFRCADADCDFAGASENDYFKCESCRRPICPNHAFQPLNRERVRFCQDCFHCTCGAEAWIMCERCGELKCPAHTVCLEDDFGPGEHSYFGLTCIEAPAPQRNSSVPNRDKLDANCPF